MTPALGRARLGGRQGDCPLKWTLHVMDECMEMYLGDGVHAEYKENNGEYIKLTQDNDIVNLEPEVFITLVDFVNQIRASRGSEPIVVPPVRIIKDEQENEIK